MPSEKNKNPDLTHLKMNFNQEYVSYYKFMLNSIVLHIFLFM